MKGSKQMLNILQLNLIVSKVEELTTSQWGLLMEDQKFYKMFCKLVKRKNANPINISKKLAKFANENIC